MEGWLLGGGGGGRLDILLNWIAAPGEIVESGLGVLANSQIRLVITAKPHTCHSKYLRSVTQYKVFLERDLASKAPQILSSEGTISSFA
jgi:hypothetical protein